MTASPPPSTPPSGSPPPPPPPPPPPSDVVTCTIDGREVKVPKGTLVVEAAKTVGIEIPVFCYHPKLKPGRRLPNVPGRDREDAALADGLHLAGRRGHDRPYDVGQRDRGAERRP